ncbi:MAG: lysophospholipid acyltransferase family protein [Actinomycetota bacterium]
MVYRFFWFTIGPLIRLYWWVRPHGRENVSRHGGVIIAANHQAAIDPVLVCMSFWRQVCWLAKVELVKTRRIAWFFRGAGVIPVDRAAPQEESADKAARVLKEGKIFGIFPEGTRSPDGRVYKGYTGVARIAQRSGAPVVPTGIVGTRKAHKKGSRLAKPSKTEVRFGTPMYFDIRAGEDEHAAYRRFTDEVLDEVARLIGAERVPDSYSRAPVRREA